jgi:hypothetical protein
MLLQNLMEKEKIAKSLLHLSFQLSNKSETLMQALSRFVDPF